MGLLSKIQDIYDFEISAFNYEALKNYLDEFDKTYSDYPLLVSIVRQMLIADQESRPSFTRLKKALPSWESLEPELVNKPTMYESKFKKNGFGVKMKNEGFGIQKVLTDSSKVSMLRNALDSSDSRQSIPRNFEENNQRESRWMSGKGIRIGESPGIKTKGLAYLPDSSQDYTGREDEYLYFQDQYSNTDINNLNKIDEVQNYRSKGQNYTRKRSTQKQKSEKELSEISQRSRSMTATRNPLKIRIDSDQFSKTKSNRNIMKKNYQNEKKYLDQRNGGLETKIISSQSNSLHQKYTTLQLPKHYNQESFEEKPEIIRGTYPNYQTRIRSNQNKLNSLFRPGSIGSHQIHFQDYQKKNRNSKIRKFEKNHFKQEEAETIWTGREKNSNIDTYENPETQTMNKNYEQNFMTSGETNFIPKKQINLSRSPHPPALDIHSINRNLSQNKNLTFSKSPKEMTQISDFKSMHHHKSKSNTHQKIVRLNMTPSKKRNLNRRERSISPQFNVGRSTIQNKTGKKRRKKSASIFDSEEKENRNISVGKYDLGDFPRYSAQPVPKEFFTLRENSYKRYCSNIVNNVGNKQNIQNNKEIFGDSNNQKQKYLIKGRTRSFNNEESDLGLYSSSRKEINTDYTKKRETPVANYKVLPLSELSSPDMNTNTYNNGVSVTTTSRGISSHSYKNGNQINNNKLYQQNIYRRYGSHTNNPLQKSLKDSEPLLPHRKAKINGMRRFSQKVVKNIGNWLTAPEKIKQNITQDKKIKNQGYANIIRAQPSQPSSFSSRYQSGGSILSRREFSSGKEPGWTTDTMRNQRLMSSINEIDRSGEVSNGHLADQESENFSKNDYRKTTDERYSNEINIDEINQNLRSVSRTKKIDIFRKKSRVSDQQNFLFANKRKSSNKMIVRLNGNKEQKKRSSNQIQRKIIANNTKKYSATHQNEIFKIEKQNSGLRDSGKNPIRSQKTSDREIETVFNSASKKKNPYNRIEQKKRRISKNYNPEEIDIIQQNLKAQKRLKRRRSREKKLYNRENFKSPESSLLRSKNKNQNVNSRISRLKSESPISHIRLVRLSQNNNHLPKSRNVIRRLNISDLSGVQDPEINFSNRKKLRNRGSSVFSQKKDKEDISKNLSRISSHSKRKNRLRERSESKESRKRKSNIKIHYQKIIPNRSRISRPPIKRKGMGLKIRNNGENKENRKSNSVMRILAKELGEGNTGLKLSSRTKNNTFANKKTYVRKGSESRKEIMRSVTSRDRAGKLKSDCISSIQMKIAGGRDSHKSKIISEDSIVCDISSFRENDTRSANRISNGPGRYAISKSIPNKGKMAPSRIQKGRLSVKKSFKNSSIKQNRVFQDIRLGKTEMLSSRATGLFKFDTRGKLIGEDLLQSKMSLDSEKVSGIHNFQNARKFQQALQQFVDQGLFRG